MIELGKVLRSILYNSTNLILKIVFTLRKKILVPVFPTVLRKTCDELYHYWSFLKPRENNREQRSS